MAKKVVMLIGLLVLGIQVVPYGRNHANPPVRQEPKWDRQEIRQLAKRACFDCHSNETKWPWYTSVAPFSWFTQNHVNEGRQKLNLSEWDRPQKKSTDAAKVIENGEMPLRSYLLAHPEARLQPAEQETLIAGLRAMLKGQNAANGSEKHEEEEPD